MTQELKPCPFCGGEAKSHFNPSCDCCGRVSGVVECSCMAEVSHFPTEAEAIAAWNTRAPASPVEAAADDLLAACKVLLAGHHALNNSDISASEISCINGLPTDDQLESARAAIAKATGQQVAK